jgi:predicted Zn-dependent protease
MKKLHAVFFIVLIFAACETNPLTGKTTMAFMPNSSLFPQSFAEYRQFLGDNASKKVSTGVNAEMVRRVGDRLSDAAQVWLANSGDSDYLKDYSWEYNLINDSTVNAWCMPGGKIVVYTGILPVTSDENGLAVVLGHEIAHALLNHGQQNLSASILQQLGAVGASILLSGSSEKVQSIIMTAYVVGTGLGTLKFSRTHESEADHYGLILMAIAGYDPDAAVSFWQRMASLGGGSTLEFLSTHPSHETRVRDLQGWLLEAKQTAAGFGWY